MRARAALRWASDHARPIGWSSRANRRRSANVGHAGRKAEFRRSLGLGALARSRDGFSPPKRRFRRVLSDSGYVSAEKIPVRNHADGPCLVGDKQVPYVVLHHEHRRRLHGCFRRTGQQATTVEVAGSRGVEIASGSNGHNDVTFGNDAMNVVLSSHALGDHPLGHLTHGGITTDQDEAIRDKQPYPLRPRTRFLLRLIRRRLTHRLWTSSSTRGGWH
jgi:hypothetical protein